MASSLDLKGNKATTKKLFFSLTRRFSQIRSHIMKLLGQFVQSFGKGMMKRSDVGLLFQVLTDSSRVYITTRESGWRQCHIHTSFKRGIASFFTSCLFLIKENLGSFIQFCRIKQSMNALSSLAFFIFTPN